MRAELALQDAFRDLTGARNLIGRF